MGSRGCTVSLLVLGRLRLPLDAGTVLEGSGGEARARLGLRISDWGFGVSGRRIETAMGRMSRSAVLLLLLVAFVPRLEAARFTDEDLEGMDLTPEERAVLTQEQVEDYNPLEQSGRLAGEDDVEIVESPEDLDDLVTSNKYVLMQFFAPWCGHCAALQPEFGKAATALKDEGVVLAKMDAVEHVEFAADYGVQAYPTLYWIVDGQKEPYNGGRSSESITSWVKKKIGPAVSVITSAKEVLEKEIPVAVAYLESVEGNDAAELNEAAKQHEGVEFFVTADAQIAKKFGLDSKTPALVLLKKQNEKVSTFEGSFERLALGAFVLANKAPLVITYSRATTSLIFQSGVSRQLLLFADSDEFAKISGDYEAAAKAYKRKIVFVHVDLSDVDVASPVLDFFALDNKKTRLLGFASQDSGAKYLYEGDFSVDSLKQFSENFLTGDLPKYLKSQEAPEKNDGAVKTVVSTTFEEIVLDGTKDVLLAVTAPWCSHCQTMEPEYEKLAEALIEVPSLVLAKMDGTKNELERVKVEGYPTLLFYPAGATEPTPVTSERKAAAILEFLKSHAKVPFEAPVIPEDEVEESEEAGEETDVKDEL